MRARDILKRKIPVGTIVYKKAYKFCDNGVGPRWRSFVLTLVALGEGVIPYPIRDATKNSVRGGKSRVPKAYVLEATGYDELVRDAQYSSCSQRPISSENDCHFTGEPIVSAYDRSFKYEVGQVVTPVNWDGGRDTTCTDGIHVFLTRKEAEAY